MILTMNGDDGGVNIGEISIPTTEDLWGLVTRNRGLGGDVSKGLRNVMPGGAGQLAPPSEYC